MKAPTTSSSYARPYDIFVGTWTGGANTFSPTGEFLSFGASTLEIYWINDNTLRFVQLMDGLASTDLEGNLASLRGEELKRAVTNVVQSSFDITVTGKAARGGDAQFDLEGTESVPGIYLFTLRSKTRPLVYSNNQYFWDPNGRNIVGPTLVDGKVVAVNAQTFTRISFDRLSLL